MEEQFDDSTMVKTIPKHIFADVLESKAEQEQDFKSKLSQESRTAQKSSALYQEGTTGGGGIALKLPSTLRIVQERFDEDTYKIESS